MINIPTGSDALTEALIDLPPKPRVHELAKRSGLSSKELIAALAERGVAAKAASSSVDRDVAVTLLTALLGDTGAGTDESAVVAEAAAAAETVAAAEVAGAAEPILPPVGTMGLFLEPDPAKAIKPRRSRVRAPSASAPGGSDVGPVPTEPSASPDGDGAAAAGPDDRPPRSQGRTRSRRKSADVGAGTDVATDTVDPAATDKVLPDEIVRSDTDPNDSENADPADQEGEPTESSESGARRRRRRGRRGRGRLDDEGAADQIGEATSTGLPADEPAEPAADIDAGNPAAGSSSIDTDAATEETESAAGTRRRRRRRRGVPAVEESTREDDPDNTVVHVREVRTGDTSISEVQGIRGSTRLEAKRQRRRDSRDSRRRPQILTEAEFLARRESVDRVMAVRQRGDLAQVALLEDNILVEHFVSKAGSASMIGNIYLGRVQNVLPSMEAAFVDIGRGRNAVLYAGEVNWDSSGLSGKARRIETALSSGDTVLVQVSKDPVGHKGARLTTQIALPGRFLVYVPTGGATGISRKLPDTERKRLKSILDRIVPDDAGVIIRTAAEGVAESELARDVERLKSQWDEIKAVTEGADSKRTVAPAQLSAEPDTLIKVVRDLFNSDINKLIIDGEDTRKSVSEYVDQVAPELSDRVIRYESTDSSRDVFSDYRIDEQIAKALERKVFLPSGGSLVIDRTEAMTVVDVNTGKYTGSGGNLEETVTKNNLEAAEEIVRQLRLRDIGGIIVVDFIDMVLESNRDLVLRRLTECLGRDRTRHQVAEVTSLGLVQMTRKRMGTGLVEAFSENCERCHGRGIVLRDIPIDHTAATDVEPMRATGKNRRERKRDLDPESVQPITRILTSRADPRGPKPPMRSGAAVLTGDAGAPTGTAVDGAAAAPADFAPADPGSATTLVPADLVDAAAVEAAPAEVAPVDAVPGDGGTAVVIAVNSDGVAMPTRSRRGRRSSSTKPSADPVSVPVAPQSTGQPPAAEIAPTVEVVAAMPAAVSGAPAGRPRRRRAASRPAGPAGSAEPVVIAAPDPAASG